MKTREFVLLIVAFMVFGGAIGGAFVGGIAVGERRGQDLAQQKLPSQSPGSTLRQSQTPGLGQSSGSQGISSSGGLTGTIEKVEGNTITVNTTRGPIRVTLGQNTLIQKSSPGSASDLQPGQQLTVVGQRAEDGTIQARSILLLPEGATGLSGDRPSRTGQQPRATP